MKCKDCQYCSDQYRELGTCQVLAEPVDLGLDCIIIKQMILKNKTDKDITITKIEVEWL